MKIDDIYIAENIREKLLIKHNVDDSEVEEIFFCKYISKLFIKKIKDDLYFALGRTCSGRYLYVLFRLRERTAHIITCYDMSPKQKKLYTKK